MKIENQFRVGLPVAETWALFQNVERIAPCMPGAALEKIEGDDYHGNVKVKLGPITAQYRGAARFVERDEARRRLVLRGRAKETKGQGNAEANVVVSLAEAGGGGTSVTVETELKLTGKVAQFGRGIMVDVSTKLLGQFVQALEAEIGKDARPAPASPTVAGSLASVEAAALPAPPATDAIDLLEVAGGSVARRIGLPLAIAAAVLGLLYFLFAR